jgi:hypothetical protein
MKKLATIELSIDGKVHFLKVAAGSNTHIIVANGELIEVKDQTVQDEEPIQKISAK